MGEMESSERIKKHLLTLEQMAEERDGSACVEAGLGDAELEERRACRA